MKAREIVPICIEDIMGKKLKNKKLKKALKKASLSRKARRVVLKIYRQRILNLEQHQDRLFKSACTQLKVDPDSNQGVIMFDFLFDGHFGKKKPVVARIEKIIFPKEPRCQKKPSEVSSSSTGSPTTKTSTR